MQIKIFVINYNIKKNFFQKTTMRSKNVRKKLK